MCRRRNTGGRRRRHRARRVRPPVAISDASRIVSVGGAVTEILYALGLESRVIAVELDQPLSRARARREAERRLHAAVVGRRRARPRSLARARRRRRGPEGNDRGAESRRDPVRARARPVHRHRHRREDPPDRGGDRHRRRAANASPGWSRPISPRSRSLRTRIPAPLRVLFLLSFMNDRPMVAGRATAADGIIRLAGAANAIAEFDGYKIVNDEAIIAARPDAVLAMERRQFASSRPTRCSPHPGFALTPAAQRKAFVVDGWALSPRLRSAHRTRRPRSRRTRFTLRSRARRCPPSSRRRPAPHERGDRRQRRAGAHRLAQAGAIGGRHPRARRRARSGRGDRGDDRRRRHSAGAALRRARLRRRRAGAARARPAGAVVDPAAADRAHRHRSERCSRSPAR